MVPCNTAMLNPESFDNPSIGRKPRKVELRPGTSLANLCDLNGSCLLGRLKSKMQNATLKVGTYQAREWCPARAGGDGAPVAPLACQNLLAGSLQQKRTGHRVLDLVKPLQVPAREREPGRTENVFNWKWER